MANMKRRQGCETEHHAQKIQKLLTASVHSAGNPDDNRTPRVANRGKRQATGAKKDLLLRAGPLDTTAAAFLRPWQTLQSQGSRGSDADGGALEDARLSMSDRAAAESYGEVPLSRSSLTKETTNSLSSYNLRLRTRGREVLLVFSMQGAGILANSLVLTFLLLVTRKRGGHEDDGEGDGTDGTYYAAPTLLGVWRITYAIGAAVLIYVLVSRIRHLTESEVWAQDRQRREEDRQQRMKREVGVGFRPPRLRPYETSEHEEKKLPAQQKAKELRQEPVISPTMSSITMKSDFDMLGSTNLDGCRMMPAVLADDVDEEDRDHCKQQSSEVMLLLRHYGMRLFGTSATVSLQTALQRH